MKRILADFLVAASSLYTKFVPDARLSEAIRSSERALSYGRNEADAVARVTDRKIRCIDVGARGGVLDYLKPYRSSLEMIMVEPDAREAEKLRAAGLRVIESLIAGHSGKAVLNVTLNPANASMLEPTGPIMNYYAGGDLARFEILDRPSLPALTLDDVVAQAGGVLDYIKLDTQGNELAILEGGEKARPLFIVSEASTAALYRDQGLIYDIGRLLHGRGYLLFDLTLRGVRPRTSPLSAGTRPSLGIPLHRDAYFMPDWTRSEGLALIAGRERVWAALMLMHGLRDILGYVLATDQIAGGQALLAELQAVKQ